MSLGRPERGGEAHADAVRDLEVANDKQAKRRQEADDARGTPEEDAAEAELDHAEGRRATREAWLTWLERGF